MWTYYKACLNGFKNCPDHAVYGSNLTSALGGGGINKVSAKVFFIKDHQLASNGILIWYFSSSLDTGKF
jgi:hypothetical protein